MRWMGSGASVAFRNVVLLILLIWTSVTLDLGRMLFGAGAADDRYRIFQRFYRLPEGLIERFYAARSTALDKMRVLAGKPPVPIGAGLRALLAPGAALAQRQP